MVLSEAIVVFLNYQQTRKSRSDSTITTYRSMLGLFMSYVGDINITDLTVQAIDKYADSLVGLKPKSIKNRLTAVRSLVSYLYAKDHITIKPEAIDIPTCKDSEANFLDYDEQKMMVAACNDKRELAIVKLLLRSGLRISELINLNIDDVFERSILVRKGKGDKARVAFITEDAEAALLDYRAAIGQKLVPCFVNRYGDRLSRQSAHKIIVKIAERSGIKKNISPHTLRHTFATNMLRAGARIEDVQKMLGHSRVETTLIYMHFTNDYLHSRYDQFAEVEYTFPQRKKAYQA